MPYLLALLGLQHIAGVLCNAQDPCRNTGQQRRKHQHAARLAGHQRKIHMAEKGHIDGRIQHTGLDHLNQAHQQQDLHGHGNDGSERVVLIALVNGVGFLGNTIFIAEKTGRDVVDLRLHFYHFNRVFLHPNRQRHEHDLADQREQNDGQAIIAAQPITKIHDHGQNIQ